MAKQITKDVHVYINHNISNDIEEYAKRNGITISKAYNQLLTIGLNREIFSKKIDSLLNTINKINANSNYNKKILQQIYTDLNLTQRDPKTSVNLNQFNAKYLKLNNKTNAQNNMSN